LPKQQDGLSRPQSLARLEWEYQIEQEKRQGHQPRPREAISDLLKATMADPMASLTDKTKVLDRALKLEALKAKFSDDEWGAGFFGGDDDDDEK